ncbi:MAG TPA: DUF4097 family beta strand repeat-containing protein [Gemmatimonadota bacterium]|nr:DUF4097 family beta strand repeat-containing protein [Gemmatimonadota bacterium]
MRRTAALAAGLVLTAVSSAMAQSRVERGVPAASDATIRIYNLSGSTHVVGWDRDSVALVAELDTGAGRLYIGGSREAIKLGVEAAGDAVPAPARFEVRVPRGSVVWVKAADASIEVDGVQGGVDLYSVTGGVRVRGAPSTVRAESMEGAISIDARTPWARAKTASGSIDLAGDITDLAATTVSGTVRVSASRQARARIESVTGEVVVSGRPTRGGAWEIETHSGSVTLALAPDTDAEIAVHTFGGEVRSELGRVGTRRVDDLAGSELVILAGTGGTSITVRTFKGPVLVRPTQ